MAQDLSVEYPDKVILITIRTIASRLWFANNSVLTEKILAFLAKYQERYRFEIFAFVLLGNHYHLLAKFPLGNRAAFLKSFNSIIPRLLTGFEPNFRDGKLWARRAKVQVVPNPEDIVDRFLYVSLNPISSGLCERISDFNGYTGLRDCFLRKGRTFRLINWKDFRNRSRFNKRLRPSDCEQEFTLVFSRLPGFEHLADADYKQEITQLAEQRRIQIIEARRDAGKGFAGRKVLAQTKPGALPRSTKTSGRESKRPLVLTRCEKTKQLFLEHYFGILDAYRKASAKFRHGNLLAVFPAGTYRPIAQVAP